MKMILEEQSLSYPHPRQMEFPHAERMDPDTFYEFCVLNPDWNLELDKNGQIHVMSPVNTDSGNYEMHAGSQVYIWNLRTGLGYTYSASTGFTLPDGSVKAPDASWVERSRIDALSPAERQKFARICPDFVIEIRSKSDRVAPLQEKMHEFTQNGCRLGFLIDPYERKAWIYRAAGTVEEVTDFSSSLSGEDALPGFELDLRLFRA